MNRIAFRFRTMRLFRRKDKKKFADADHGYQNGTKATNNGYGSMPAGGPGYGAGAGQLQRASPRSARLIADLPDHVLERIFLFVCPHTGDETYETCEQSSEDDACMLCDQRDLAHCVAVSKQWRRAALSRLYYSIRIDTVHYCEREIYLSDMRKRRSFFDHNGLPEDTSHTRLKLLCRTLREDPTRLGARVHYFKTPYMLRESCQADLARTIAVLPNLRYVDLPEGLFADEPTYMTLRMEVQARCHHLRKMTYAGGSERSIEALATGTVWSELEVLELVGMWPEPAVLRHVLGALRNLQALKVSKPRGFIDDMFLPKEMLPPFPALQELIITDVLQVTAKGLCQWISSRPDVRARLKTLSLSGTGVKPWTLHRILSEATALENLTIVCQVAASLPTAAGTHDIPPLRSTSLKTLNYEITASSTPYSLNTGGSSSSITSSYYNYLSGSLLSGGLPNLRAVYVRDANFPDSLLGLPPPPPTFADGFGGRRPSTAEGAKSSSAGGFLSPNGTGHNPFQDPANSMPLPQKPFAGAGHNPRFSSNNPFAAMIPTKQLATLEVFTKGDDELDWSFVRVSGSGFPGVRGGGAGGEPTRPHSSYGLSSEAGWGATAGARRSVFMGDGGGGFLAVPGAASPRGAASRPAFHGRTGSSSSFRGGDGGGDWPVHVSAGLDKKKDRKNLWR